MFTTYHVEQVMTSDGNIYYLQYASFTKKTVMEENLKKLNHYLIKEKNNKYYVYVGATTILENAHIIQRILENDGIYTYIKNDYIGNEKIVNDIAKIDKKISQENNEYKIIEWNNAILKLLK